MSAIDVRGPIVGDRDDITVFSTVVAAAAGSTASYVVREEDGTSKIIKEEGDGFVLTEEST